MLRDFTSSGSLKKSSFVKEKFALEGFQKVPNRLTNFEKYCTIGMLIGALIYHSHMAAYSLELET